MSTELTGEADGDSSYDPYEAARLDVIASSEQTDIINAAYAGATTSGTAAVESPPGLSTNSPNRRQSNPLSNFSSYTYQLTLYMISPDAYSAFNESGRKNVRTAGTNGDIGLEAYILAQSGGINNKSNTRAPGFELDYYIDDFKTVTTTSGESSGTASNVTSMSFNIYEPYGFSFITKLRNASDSIVANSKLPNIQDSNNPLRQFFLLSVRFQGYDINGKAVTGADAFATDTYNPNSAGVFERFYDIVIQDMKFKIDGKATVYQIKATSIAPYVGYGIKKGRFDHTVNIVAETVEEALGGGPPGVARKSGVIGLLDKLNMDQQNYAKEIGPTGEKTTRIANEYSLEFIGMSDRLRKSIIATDTDKSTWPMSLANNVIESNDAIAVTTIPNSSQRSLTFKNDTAIIQAIQIIIANSSYLSDALKVIKTNALEPAPPGTKDGDTDADQKTNKTSIPVQWYNLSTSVTCKGWDPVIGDYAYKIKYVIQPYDTPATISSYTNLSSPYYGPHKKYEYWFTGKNSEVINYEQTMDTTYFNSFLAPSGTSQSQGAGADIPGSVGKQSDAPKLGSLNEGLAAENSYVTNLYSPKDWAGAKITILGDPDYLIQDSEGALSKVYNKFYGSDGYTINANGGQVFIEIRFNEAQDYTNSNGLMSINESIVFWKYPEAVKKLKLKGISYRVKQVTSMFSKGKFTQDLDCSINTFPDVPDDAEQPGARETPADSVRPKSANTTVSGVTAQILGPVSNESMTVPAPAVQLNAAKDSALADLPVAFNAARDSQAASVVQDDDSSYNSAEAVRLSRLQTPNVDSGRENE